MKRLLILALVLTASLGWSEPLWWQAPAGPAYQVLIYSFADSDGDGMGDFKGLTHRLDAIKSLGTTAIWLSPLHPAASYHGYDVMDYKAVNPEYGSLADFDAFVKAAHAKNIKVLLDMVFNHTSSRHPWFKAKPDWYITKKAGVTYGGSTMGSWYTKGNGTSYYGTFWDQMPDLDLTNPEVVAEQKSILKFWLDRGVDGFRFDAAKEIFNTGKVEEGFPVVVRSKAYWNEMRDYARSLNPAVYFIGEVSTTSNQETAAYAGAFDGLFDFVQAKSVLADLPASGSAPKLVSSLETNYRLYKRAQGFVPAAFLSNHDQDRAMSVTLAKFDAPGQDGVGPTIDDVPAISEAKEMARLRYQDQVFIYLTLPGLPYIYYGEELGLAGRRYKNDDISRRDALPWGDDDAQGDTTTWMRNSGKLEPGQNKSTTSWADQEADPDSLLNWYRTLGNLRKDHPALRGMTFAGCPWAANPDGTVVAYFREAGGEKLLATVNLGWTDAVVSPPAGTKLTPVVSLGKAPVVGETLTLPPGAAILWTVTNQ